MDLDIWVDGQVPSPRIGSMDSVQVGKAVFVKESYTTLGIEPRTYSNPGRSGKYSLAQLGKKKIIFLFSWTRQEVF